MKRTAREPSGHPAVEALADLAEKRLSRSAVADLERHLDGCSPCRERLAEVAALLSRLEGRHLERPPEWLRAWAADLPRSHPRRAAPPRRSLLRLVFDSLTLEPAGVRSLLARPRRLVFREGTVDVDVEIEVRPGGAAALRGQVLDASVPGGRTFAAGRVVLRRGRAVAARAALSERGRFHVPSLPPGTVSLRIEARGFDCRIPPFEI